MSTPEDLAGQIAADMGIPASLPMTEKEHAEFAKRFEAAWKEAQGKPLQVLNRPSLPPPPDDLRAFAREFAVVVRPGETLIIRVGNEHTPNQIRELHDTLNDPSMELPFKVLVVPGEDFAVGQPEITHACPVPGEWHMPCCGKTPYEVPRTDRIALDHRLASCKGASGA